MDGIAVRFVTDNPETDKHEQKNFSLQTEHLIPLRCALKKRITISQKYVFRKMVWQYFRNFIFYSHR
jgi:hypothetical protein